MSLSQANRVQASQKKKTVKEKEEVLLKLEVRSQNVHLNLSPVVHSLKKHFCLNCVRVWRRKKSSRARRRRKRARRRRNRRKKRLKERRSMMRKSLRR